MFKYFLPVSTEKTNIKMSLDNALLESPNAEKWTNHKEMIILE